MFRHLHLFSEQTMTSFVAHFNREMSREDSYLCVMKICPCFINNSFQNCKNHCC